MEKAHKMNRGSRFYDYPGHYGDVEQKVKHLESCTKSRQKRKRKNKKK